ncbi:MAG: PhzF family phenazine biosynthesis protein [Gammaproteobacteria bacterium]|nr:PhzF family phenazine biosynthesis protein [Gammaproteobacteria bacterium]
MECAIVDVFAERPLEGNQLAVVRGCAKLGTSAMQAVAHEMNFSETTFVVAEREHEADVRIFTPTVELPFAGHPTLGTAWVLGRHQREFTLNLKGGRVRVTFAEDGIVWMQPPAVALGEALPAAASAALVQLDERDLAPAYPSRSAAVGPHFALIGLRSLDALQRARPPATDVRSPLDGSQPLLVFAFTDEAHTSDGDFAARMFFDANGWREDPATGSANTAFAAYLRVLGRGGTLVIEQGYEMGRPSRLYLDVGADIFVGGKVHPVMSGKLLPGVHAI